MSDCRFGRVLRAFLRLQLARHDIRSASHFAVVSVRFHSFSRLVAYPNTPKGCVRSGVARRRSSDQIKTRFLKRQRSTNLTFEDQAAKKFLPPVFAQIALIYRAGALHDATRQFQLSDLGTLHYRSVLETRVSRFCLYTTVQSEHY